MDFQKKIGTFVTIKKNGELRGYIGTYLPIRKNVAEEMIFNTLLLPLEMKIFAS